MFPREYTGQFAENDIYIECRNDIRIYHYGKAILQAYIPSKGRGRNIVKAIQAELEDDVIFHIEESDSEVLFRFNSKYMADLEKYLKPKTFGSNISPFSSRNLPRNKDFKLPVEEEKAYKKITSKIPREGILSISHITNSYLKSLIIKENTWEDIKADMVQKGLKGKEYIYSIGHWNEYLRYLETNLCNEK